MVLELFMLAAAVGFRVACNANFVCLPLPWQQKLGEVSTNNFGYIVDILQVLEECCKGPFRCIEAFI